MLNSNSAVLGVPHAPRIPPLNLVSSPSLPLEKGRRVLGTRLATSCPLLAAGVCKYPKRLFPASRRFFYHVVMCSYWIVLYHCR